MVDFFLIEKISGRNLKCQINLPKYVDLNIVQTFQIFLFPECSLASENLLESSLSVSSLAVLHLVAFVGVPRSLHFDCR